MAEVVVESIEQPKTTSPNLKTQRSQDFEFVFQTLALKVSKILSQIRIDFCECIFALQVRES